jgi:hypothetical protein
MTVNGSDPRWRTINGDSYHFVNERLDIKDFPISNPVKREVEYEEITFDRSVTTQEILDTIRSQDLWHPERDEAETYFDALSNSKRQLDESPIVALCGTFIGGNHRYDRGVSCIIANKDGRSLSLFYTGKAWVQKCRFLVVHKRTGVNNDIYDSPEDVILQCYMLPAIKATLDLIR